MDNTSPIFLAEAEANKKVADSITSKLIEDKLAEARLKHGWVTVTIDNYFVDMDNTSPIFFIKGFLYIFLRFRLQNEADATVKKTTAQAEAEAQKSTFQFFSLLLLVCRHTTKTS